MEFQQFKIGFLILIFFKILISISNANEESYRISHAIIPEEKYLFNEPRSRVKRDSKLSAAEKKLALDTHNKLRANETAKNMREFVWDPVIAEMAQKWAENCEFKHGQPSGFKHKFGHVSNNLFIIPGKATLETSIKLFYGEKKFYDYEKTRCMPGRVCGHYTQVVWATTTHLGCAVHVCEPLKFTTGNTWKKAEFHVCNYAEGGNFAGVPIFKKGKRCRGCPPEAKMCRNNLCSTCTSGSDCTCKLFCLNCGERKSDCTCKCKDGFWGHDCSKQCIETNSRCGKSWKKEHCDQSRIKNACPITCGLCKTGKFDASKCPKTDNGIDCVGYDCDNGGNVVESSNKCVCKCPNTHYGKKCGKSRDKLKVGLRLYLKSSLSKVKLQYIKKGSFIILSILKKF